MSHKSAWKAEKMGYNNVKVFAAGFPEWMKAPGSYASVTTEYVAQQLATNEALVIDSRPKKPKYDKGHIPTAMSIPDSQFEALQGKLPRDPDTMLIFYCEGYT